MNRNNSIIAVFVLLLTLVILPGLKTQATEIALVQPELEYLFMDDGQADDGLGKLVIASIKTEGLQLETAALEYKDSETGETVQVPSDEIIEGYAAFLIKTEVTQTDLLKLSLQLNGEAFDIDLAEFYQASDVEEVEVEAVEDNDVPLEESLSIEEIQDIVADGSEDIETVLEQSNDIVPRSGNLIQSFAKGNVIVVLDPGHGGSDPGAPSNPITYNGVTYIEKTIALKIALATKAELEKYTGVTVYMTRSDDRALTLKERVDFGKAKGATVFVSQHLNASGTGKVRGALVLVSKGQYRPELGQASGDLAKRF
jgi:N-acetylmuramoyl-L-alanine amidase